MVEPSEPPPRGAKALKEEFFGLSAHKLRMKIVALQREINKVQRKLKAKKNIADATAELHQKNVELERNSRSFMDIIINVQSEIDHDRGAWVLGDPGVPKVLEGVRELRHDRDRLQVAARGFTEMWRRVTAEDKRRILAECEANHMAEIKAAVEFAARVSKTQRNAQPDPNVTPKVDGLIIPFASKGDKF